MTGRFEELLDRLVDNCADTSDLVALESLTTADPALARVLVETCEIEGLLRSGDVPQLAGAVLDRISQERVRGRVRAHIEDSSTRLRRQPSRSRRLSRSRRSRTRSRPFRAPALAMAITVAVIIMGVVITNQIGFFASPIRDPQPQIQEVETIVVHLDGAAQVDGQTYLAGAHNFPVSSVVSAEQATLRLADGTEIHLDHALLTMPSSTTSQRFHQSDGVARYRVQPRGAGAPAFEVSTNGAQVTVLGTEFVVDQSLQTRIEVVHGRVEVTAQDQRLELADGEQARLIADSLELVSSDVALLTIEDITMRIIDGTTGAIDSTAAPLRKGSVVDLADYPDGFNILVEVPDQVQSFFARVPESTPYRFNPVKGDGRHFDSEQPFSLWGERKDSGEFYAVMPRPGRLSVRFEVFDAIGIKRSLGVFRLTIDIIDSRKKKKKK